MSKTLRLAQILVGRQSALRLPEPVFTGWGHFVSEMNKFINEYVRKKPGDPLTFVTLEGEPTRDRAVLSVYLENEEREDWNTQKMIQAVRYFAGEMGVKVGQEQLGSRGWLSILLLVEGLDMYAALESHAHVRDPWLRQALESGQMIDVRMVGIEVEPEVFRLDEFIPDVQYRDVDDEQPIRSIGRDLETGEILAATDNRFHLNEDYECLYLL